MPEILAAFEYGGYVSIVKIITLIAFFIAWMPLVNWVHLDTQAVRTKKTLWTASISCAGCITLFVWLLAPFFLIGMLIYIIAIGGVMIAYVVHRNSLVADFEKVLTVNHIKGLFVNEKKNLQKASQGISFVTANGNDVPLPAAKSIESYAYQTACQIYEDAAWRRASDVNFRPAEEEYTISYIIDGLAIKQPNREREEIEDFIKYLKQIADLDVNEKRKPQTGKMESVINKEKIKWEVTTAGSTAGEQLRIRRVQKQEALKLEDLGLEKDQIENLKKVRNIPKGLFITSGPAKMGVTSTLYAMIKNHDPFMNDINTIEKETIGTLENVTQHVWKMTDSSTVSFAEKLMTIVRMGANIIGVSDCEDAESAKIATNAASIQNRMVHVSIEATSSINALAKWIKLTGDKRQVLDNTVGIINQRLTRKLCDECKQAYKPNPSLLKKFNIPADKVDVFYRPGEIEYDKNNKPIICEKCQGTGYYGRTGVYETVIIDDSLREMLKKAKSMQDIALSFRKAKVATIQQRSLQKVTNGTTSINEVIRELSSSNPKAASKPKPKTEK